jgi:hypothetical protein
MLPELRIAAKQVGITLVIAESDKSIENQLNRITRKENLPVMLSSWDLNVALEFDSDTGFLKNPTVDVTLLLVTKAETLEKKELEASAEEMGRLFIKFVKNFKKHLIANTNVKENPLTNISFTYVPSFGAAKHSGVLGEMKIQQNLETNAC